MRSRGKWQGLKAGAAGVVAAAAVSGAIAGVAVIGSSTIGVMPAGADTSPYLLSCDLAGTPIPIPGAVTTGSLPGSVVAGSTFSLANYGMQITLPSTGVFAAAAGATVSGTYTTTLTASGATPTSESASFNIPTTTIPNPMPAGGVPLSATGTAGAFTAPGTSGPVTISTGTTSTMVVNVDGNPVTLSCTEPSVTIATTTVSSPHTSVTSVLPNAGPLAGGESVTITGTSLANASAVDFGSTPATIASDTDTTIVATEPPGTAGTVDVQVTTPIGSSAITPADRFTYTDGPIVTGVTPDQGVPAGGTTVTVNGLQLTGATAVSFGDVPATSFTVDSDTSITAVSPAQPSGTVDVSVVGPKGTSVISSQDQFNYLSGYWEVASDGGIFTFGGAHFYGSMGGTHLNKPVVGIASTPDHSGYWEVASDGGIFSFGNAQFYGSMGGTHLNRPIVGMAVTPDGEGYWEVASDGGIFSFGDAHFYGSKGGSTTTAPIVGMQASPTGNGYWEVASDGTIYAFGNAGVYGSIAGHPLNAPIVAGASTAGYNGDWEVASDGGIFAFGSAQFLGSMGGTPLNKPIVGFAALSSGQGYWEVASDGGIFSFGSAHFYGSMGGQPLNAPVVGIAIGA